MFLARIYIVKIYVDTEYTIDASEVRDVKGSGETISGVSTELMEEGIRANSEYLNVQISTLTQLLNQRIQDNSAKSTPTSGPHTHRPQAEPSFSREFGTGGVLPGTTLGVTGLPLDIGWYILNFQCPNFVCCCDVFQVSSKKFKKIRRDFVVWFQINFVRPAINEVIEIFGRSLLKFTSGRQTYHLAAHYNKNNVH